jgi:hypothetical protein
VRVERIGHDRTTAVADHDREIVLDRDARREHVPVPQVAVVLLGVPVQRPQHRVGTQVERERVGARRVDRAPFRALAHPPGAGVLGTVEAEGATREHPLGKVGQPPVHQVEVVGSLVYG